MHRSGEVGSGAGERTVSFPRVVGENRTRRSCALERGVGAGVWRLAWVRLSQSPETARFRSNPVEQCSVQGR